MSRLSNRIRNWTEWFIQEGEETTQYEQSEQVDVVAGSHHMDYEKLDLKRKMPPRCAKCKRFMGFDDGMFIILNGNWRIHIGCFSEVLERHFEQGKVIDLTTGHIVSISEEEDGKGTN